MSSQILEIEVTDLGLEVTDIGDEIDVITVMKSL